MNDALILAIYLGTFVVEKRMVQAACFRARLGGNYEKRGGKTHGK
jgi:hypothetical protein